MIRTQPLSVLKIFLLEQKAASGSKQTLKRLYLEFFSKIMTREFRLENQMTSSNIFTAVYVQIPKILGPVSVNYGTGQLRHGLSTYYQ